MTSKERSKLMSLAQKLEPVVKIGKAGLTPEITTAVDEAIAARELIKVDVLKNCDFEAKELAITLAERSRSQLVQVIGRKIVLYKPAALEKDRKIGI